MGLDSNTLSQSLRARPMLSLVGRNSALRAEPIAGRLCLMENTPVATPVNWEAVRMLAVVVGVRESARRMGLSEEQVKRRCSREGWLNDPAARAANQNAVAGRSGRTAALVPSLSPQAVLNGELAALGSKTRLSLARAIGKAGDHIAELPAAEIVEQSSNVKNIAQTADLVHGWKDAAPQVKIRLDVLGAPAEAQIVEIESSVSDWTEEECSTDLDDY
jgi:hypothetical protein